MLTRCSKASKKSGPNCFFVRFSRVFNFNDPCALISPFTVRPSITITVDSEQSHSQTNCYGNIRTFSAQLWVENPNGEMVRFEESSYNAVTYTFDWFLGNREEYDGYTTTSKTLPELRALRESVTTM